MSLSYAPSRDPNALGLAAMSWQSGAVANAKHQAAPRAPRHRQVAHRFGGQLAQSKKRVPLLGISRIYGCIKLATSAPSPSIFFAILFCNAKLLRRARAVICNVRSDECNRPFNVGQLSALHQLVSLPKEG